MCALLKIAGILYDIAQYLHQHAHSKGEAFLNRQPGLFHPHVDVLNQLPSMGHMRRFSCFDSCPFLAVQLPSLSEPEKAFTLFH